MQIGGGHIEMMRERKRNEKAGKRKWERKHMKYYSRKSLQKEDGDREMADETGKGTGGGCWSIAGTINRHGKGTEGAGPWH